MFDFKSARKYNLPLESVNFEHKTLNLSIRDKFTDIILKRYGFSNVTLSSLMDNSFLSKNVVRQACLIPNCFCEAITLTCDSLQSLSNYLEGADLEFFEFLRWSAFIDEDGHLNNHINAFSTISEDIVEMYESYFDEDYSDIENKNLEKNSIYQRVLSAAQSVSAGVSGHIDIAMDNDDVNDYIYAIINFLEQFTNGYHISPSIIFENWNMFSSWIFESNPDSPGTLFFCGNQDVYDYISNKNLYSDEITSMVEPAIDLFFNPLCGTNNEESYILNSSFDKDNKSSIVLLYINAYSQIYDNDYCVNLDNFNPLWIYALEHISKTLSKN